ncbi:MAG: hypothetical protein OES57_00480 [Acidimicrobiia bacterium]|nr:hypothetical protein [Acidimicrobiia bacterium]
MLIVLALLGAACASEPTAEEKAAARAALLGDGATGQRRDPTPIDDETPPDDSALSESADGEPTAPESVGETTPGPVDGERLDRALASVPDDGLRFQLAAALGLAKTASSRCSDIDAWVTATDEASTAANTAATTARAVGGEWLGTDQAAVVAASFRDALVLQVPCQVVVDTGDVESAMAAAGRASAANDEVLLALTSRNPATGSEFWYHADQLGHTIEIDRLVRQEGPVEILVIGSSTAKRGFDPGVMTDELGRSTMNAAVAGLFPTTMDVWATDAIRLGGEPATVVIGLSTFQDFLECTDDRRQKMVDAGTMQTFAFAALDILAGEEPARRLIGGTAATYRSTVLDEYAPAPGSRGQMVSPDVPNPESVAYYTQLYTPRMAGAEYCPQNAPAIEQLITSLVDGGRRVLTVSLPLSPAMAALHPDGRAAHDQSVETYREVTQAAGGEWLDLTDLLTDEEFLDLTHATSGGRAKITEATIEALR